MDAASVPSYVHGASPVPLLGETIGQNLDRTAARVPGKVQKFKMRETSVTELGLQDAAATPTA
jgi:hypothetical protein